MFSGKDDTGREEVEDVVDSSSTEGPSELLPLPVERQAEDGAGDGGSYVGPDNDGDGRVDGGVGLGHQINDSVGCDLPRRQFLISDLDPSRLTEEDCRRVVDSWPMQKPMISLFSRSGPLSRTRLKACGVKERRTPAVKRARQTRRR